MTNSKYSIGPMIDTSLSSERKILFVMDVGLIDDLAYQIDKVSVGDIVDIENRRVKMFGGQFQVNIGRNSKLNVTKPIEVGPSKRKHRS
jgi:hypothetical protein